MGKIPCKDLGTILDVLGSMRCYSINDYRDVSVKEELIKSEIKAIFDKFDNDEVKANEYALSGSLSNIDINDFAWLDDKNIDHRIPPQGFLSNHFKCIENYFIKK